VNKFRTLLTIRWWGQVTDGIFQSALASFVLFSPERQPNAVAAAVAFSVVLLPYSVVGPFAGIFLDRFSRQRIVVISNLLRALSLIVIAVLIKSGSTGLLLTLFVLIAFGINRLILAGLSAGLPLVIERERLIGANALAVTGGTIGVVIGGGIGIGAKNLLDHLHKSDFSDFVVILIAATSYLIAASLAMRLTSSDIGPHEHEVTNNAGIAEIRAGFAILRDHSDALRGIFATAIQRGGLTSLTLMGLLLERNTYHSPTNPDAGLKGFAFALAIAGVGIGIGSFISPVLVARFGRHLWIRVSLVSGIPFLILFAIFGHEWLLITTAFFVGLFGQSVKVTTDALVQSRIDDEFRGRTFAFYDVVVNGAIVAGALLAAVILPKSGTSHILPLVMSAVYALTAVRLLGAKRFYSLPTT